MTVCCAMPTVADQAQTDLETALRLSQEQQQQQMIQQQQSQQLQQFSLGTAGVKTYCIQYGTCTPSNNGAAAYRQKLDLDTLFPGLFGQTPKTHPAVYPTAEDTPEKPYPASHQRHHHKRHRAGRDVSN